MNWEIGIWNGNIWNNETLIPPTSRLDTLDLRYQSGTVADYMRSKGYSYTFLNSSYGWQKRFDEPDPAGRYGTLYMFGSASSSGIYWHREGGGPSFPILPWMVDEANQTMQVLAGFVNTPEYSTWTFDGLSLTVKDQVSFEEKDRDAAEIGTYSATDFDKYVFTQQYLDKRFIEDRLSKGWVPVSCGEWTYWRREVV